MNDGLSADAISFAYERGEDVLRDVSVSISPGAITGIVGPNGSGKSTLLRIAAGLLQPAGGSVTLHGRPLGAWSMHERATAIGFLPQSVAPVFSLSALEVACLGRFPHGGLFGGLGAGDLAAVERAMAQTSTLEFAERAFATLSGGERQRVLLASVLAQEAKLLLLDEPTAALDIHHEAEIFALLRELSGAGYGIGVVTHDLNLAAQFCSEVLLISRGHDVAANGAPEAVFTEANLSAAYGGPIRVGAHPFTGTPFVAAVR